MEWLKYLMQGEFSRLARHKARGSAAVLMVLIGCLSAPAVLASDFRRFDSETPPLQLRDLNDRMASLTELRGKVVLINFWATWCPPCREEMPELDTLKKRFAPQGFEVLAVNYGESEAKVRNFLSGQPHDYRVLLDRDNVAARDWKVRGLPASFLIDRNGRVGSYIYGVPDWGADDVIRRLQDMLRR